MKHLKLKNKITFAWQRLLEHLHRVPLNEGCSLQHIVDAQLEMFGPTREACLPADFLYSLMLYDGQPYYAGVSMSDGVIDGARLLSIGEIVKCSDDPAIAREIRLASPLNTPLPLVPVTERRGPHRYFIDSSDGSVWMLAGWNSHRVADSWHEFLFSLLDMRP